mmetsp:Transcript_49958/g.154382  ORF Transcript_49958/g.154382 Transcript_49958/m.154382 type:complete len:215 (-) Transcript_49958:665-1309(-)
MDPIGLPMGDPDDAASALPATAIVDDGSSMAGTMNRLICEAVKLAPAPNDAEGFDIRVVAVPGDAGSTPPSCSSCSRSRCRSSCWSLTRSLWSWCSQDSIRVRSDPRLTNSMKTERPKGSRCSLQKRYRTRFGWLHPRSCCSRSLRALGSLRICFSTMSDQSLRLSSHRYTTCSDAFCVSSSAPTRCMRTCWPVPPPVPPCAWWLVWWWPGRCE